MASAGIVNPPDTSYEVVINKDDHTYKKVVLKDGCIVGMVATGDIEKSGIVFSLIKEGVKVDRFKQALVAADFGLASLPEEIWRARLAMPTSGLNSPTIRREETEDSASGD